MKITLNRLFIFVSIVLMAALAMQQCWQRKSEAEKWLYMFGEPAREYGGRVLGPDRGTGLPPPDALSKMGVDVHPEQGYIVYSSDMFAGTGTPLLRMAFAPGGPPPAPADRPGNWSRVRDSWYWLQPMP